MKIRKITMTATAALLAAATLTACGGQVASSAASVTAAGSATASASKSGATETLVVSTWGFNSDKEKENVYEPFEKKYNCKVVVEEGNNGERLAKLEQNPSAYDVVNFADYYALQAIQKGLIAKLDRSKLTNLDKIYDKAKTPNGSDYGPAFTFNRMGIMYDKKTVKTPITSWKDLWRSDLKGMIAIPDISTTTGPMMLNIAANQLGSKLSVDNTDKVFSKLKEMAPNVVKYYSKSSDVVNMFNQGEVSVAVLQDFSSATIRKASSDFVWVDPSEGTWGCCNVSNISSGSKHKELAQKYIDFLLDKDVQKNEAAGTGNAPVRSDVKLTAQESQSMTYGQKQVDSIQYPDWNLYMKNSKTWTDLWNKDLNTESGK
ncbi:MAG: ABC transporter substrate-binding protein [Oscillospiraceae bacterium]|jgi:putative spermidine/putrescine transport system substrate-binding protein|nr:ABC transporter substrate-binding protein [Oscillospiraceae bacterium]MDD3260543.1 ABC transporter substrate-binding protein [Oscillospiraceae bacterium]